MCSRNHSHKITLGQPFGCKIQTVQEHELTAKMPRKCSFQDCWLKDSAYQEWVLKDKLDKHYAWCVACKLQLIFVCSLLLWWSLQNLILVLTSPYLALVQGPGNHVEATLLLLIIGQEWANMTGQPFCCSLLVKSELTWPGLLVARIWSRKALLVYDNHLQHADKTAYAFSVLRPAGVFGLNKHLKRALGKRRRHGSGGW